MLTLPVMTSTDPGVRTHAGSNPSAITSLVVRPSVVVKSASRPQYAVAACIQSRGLVSSQYEEMAPLRRLAREVNFLIKAKELTACYKGASTSKQKVVCAFSM